jgi:outer membrane protein assembly factor BamB
MRALRLTLILAASAATAPAPAVDWPQYLGPSGTGVVDAKGTFAAGFQLRKGWSAPVEGGTSGLAVAQGRVFTLDQRDDQDVVVALSADDGRELWRAPLDPTAAGATGGPGSTPAVIGDLVFTLSTACRLRAHDVATGAVKWDTDLVKRFGASARRGCHSSPIVAGNRLVLQPAGAEDHRVVALDPRTGDLAWSAKGVERAPYSTPVLAEVGGQAVVLVHHVAVGPPPRSGLTALRPSDGTLVWSHTLPQNVSFETPVVLPGARVAVVTWNDTQVVRVASEGGTTRVVPDWTTTDLKSHVSPPVVAGGHVYGFSGDTLSCLRAEGGPPVWSTKLYPGSAVLADGHLVVLGASSGLLRVAEARPDGWREKGSVQALPRGARADTPPALAGNRIFVRGEDSIAAIEIVR